MVTTNRICSTDGHIPILDDIYDESSTQKCPLGTRMAWADGRIYKYFQNGGSALAASKLFQTTVLSTGWDNSVKPAAAYSAGVTQIGCSATAGTSVVDTNIEVTACVDGFIGIRTGAGQCYQYQIKSHTAISSNSAFTMNLYDPIKVALGSTASCCLIRNPYKDVIVAPTTATGAVAGVSVMVVTANYYSWGQTWGLGLGYSDTTYPVAAGGGVTRSAGTAGYISGITTVAAATHSAILGEAINAGTADQATPVMWKISP